MSRIEAEAREFYFQDKETRSRQKFEPAGLDTLMRQAREAVSDLFNDKCAYCETSVAASSGGYLDRFRPQYDASSLSGQGDPDHYGWLTAEWENIYMACPACSRAKRTLFPVEGQRGPVLAPLRHLRLVETPMLLDPCWDEPADHLAFLSNGFVQGLSPRGETTVKVLNLNRKPLVRERYFVWRRISDYVTAGKLADAVRETQPSAPWAAAARAALAATREGPRGQVSSQFVTSSQIVDSRDERSAEDILASDEEAFRLTARPLRLVKITNFRALRNVEISFDEPGAGPAPWLTLLGENATGKSTALQAIALALAGAREAGRLTRPSRVLSSGAQYGSVKVWFWDQDEPAELHFKRRHRGFEGTGGPSAIVLGYGALRYAERKTRRNDPDPRFSRVAPLIEPIAKIRYPGLWFSELDNQHFDTAARALLSILPDGESAMVHRRRDGNLAFDLNGHRAALAELSAGYQAVIGMCADIMRLLFERWDTLSSATAIVLIDEIDAHLHPQWAMRIVTALRSAFPQVQFITSTHNPLSLRGLRNREVALVRLDETMSVVIDQNLPPIDSLWVDEILTSRVFGLKSTADPEKERLIEEYYYLKVRPASETDRLRMAEIRREVGDREVLGRSESEQLMLEAASAFVRSVDSNERQSGDLREETLLRLQEIAARGTDLRGQRL